MITDAYREAVALHGRLRVVVTLAVAPPLIVVGGWAFSVAYLGVLG